MLLMGPNGTLKTIQSEAGSKVDARLPESIEQIKPVFQRVLHEDLRDNLH